MTGDGKKLLLNENCTGLAHALRKKGYDVESTKGGTTDPEVQRTANESGRVVITADTDWRKKDMRKRQRTGCLVIENRSKKEKLRQAEVALKKHWNELQAGKGFTVAYDPDTDTVTVSPM